MLFDLMCVVCVVACSPVLYVSFFAVFFLMAMFVGVSLLVDVLRC